MVSLLKTRITHIGVLILAVIIGHLIAYKMVHVPNQLEVVILFGLLIFYPVLRQPLSGMYILFVLSPFIPYIRRLFYLKYSRPALDPLIVVGDILLIFILAGLFFVFKERFDRKNRGSPYFNIIFIYFIYLLIRSIFFNQLPLSEGIAKFKYYGPPVLFFLVGTLYTNKLAHLKRIWQITIVIGVIASLYGIIQLYFGYSKAENLWLSSIEFTTLFIQGIARPFSIFQAPVAFGDYMLLSIIAVLMLTKWTQNKFSFLLLLLIPLFIYAILLTSVRSCWIGIIIILVIWYTLFRVKGNRNRILLLSGLAILYVISQFSLDLFQSGLNLDSALSLISRGAPNRQTVDLLITQRSAALSNPFKEYSFLSRIALWQDLLVYSKEPVAAFLGRGVGALKADSLYFTYLAEFGYPGFIFIILLFVKFVLNGLFVIDNSKSAIIVGLAKGITIMNITIAIISVTGTHIHYFPGDVYFWFFNGVLMELYIRKKGSLSKNEPDNDSQMEYTS